MPRGLESCQPGCLSRGRKCSILCEERVALPTTNVQVPYGGSHLSSGPCLSGAKAWLFLPAFTAFSSLGLTFPVCQTGTKATTELLPRQPHDPVLGSRSTSGRTEEEQSPSEEKPREPHEGQGQEVERKDKVPNGCWPPCHQPSPAGASSPGPSPAWQEPQPRAQHTRKWTWAPRQWPVAEEGHWDHPSLSLHVSKATRSSSRKHRTRHCSKHFLVAL